MPAGKEEIHQLAAQLRQLAPAALERSAMLQLWIHRTQILQQQFDGIHLLLVEQRRCGLKGRIHDGTNRREGDKAKQQNFPLIEAEKLS
jgi:hypothetical protein